MDISDSNTHLVCSVCMRVLIPNRKLTERRAKQIAFPNHEMYVGHVAVPVLRNEIWEFHNRKK